MTISRREFLAAAAGGLSGGLMCAGPSRHAAAQASSGRRLAVVTTVYRRFSHAYHIAGRFLHGYILNGRHHQPDDRVVSMFVDQVGRDDMSRDLARQFGFEHCRSIREALTGGSNELAVDGVLLIGEHGDYPENKYGQPMYPRHQMMSEIVDAFRATGRAVPVFNDKHLSYTWDKAKQMYDWSKELDFAFQAGSSLPVTWRRPELELPLGTRLEEALAVGYGGAERYGFHALETLQCHVERREGGETGVESVHTLTGEAVWKAMDQRLWSPELLDAALGRSHTVDIGNIRDNVAEPIAYRIRYRDGLEATVLMLNGHVRDFTFAAKIKGQSEPVAALHALPDPPGAKYFDALVYNIERMLKAGRAVIPVERTLLVSGVLEALMHSRYEQAPKATPYLQVAYTAPENSGFFRGAVDRIGQR